MLKSDSFPIRNKCRKNANENKGMFDDDCDCL